MKIVNKGLKIRLYPNDFQVRLLEKTFGCCRYVYNHLLQYANDNKQYNRFKLQKVLTELKHSEETSFLKEADKFALQNEVKFLRMAFDNYFNHRAKRPKFKSKKKAICSYQTNFTNNNIVINDGNIKLPKLGLIKCSNNFNAPLEQIISVTVVKEKSGKYYASINYKAKVLPLNKTKEQIGVDLGVRKLITTSDNYTVKIPEKAFKVNIKARREHRRLSRKQQDSKNHEKQRKILSSVYAKRKNIVDNTLHQVSYSLVKKYDDIYIEDLDVNQLLLLQNRKAKKNKMIVSSLGKLRTLIKYKAFIYDKQVHEIYRYYASSQICFNCKSRYDVKESEVYHCPYCNTVIDRDFNAALNILYEGTHSKIQ